ncbi:MAG: lysylphosphatidylglycerol synthase transmembrane domain-containing protein [Acidithiobacillus sp.]|uniref:lysylphosphatidylglycerol synthase transmembrane domain-containing protein n=1 Tax=Acidithiobacillus sp. TaxID=1872118 RepID=UPI003D001EFF
MTTSHIPETRESGPAPVHKRRGHWQLLAQVLFTLAVLAWLLHQTDWQALTTRILQANPFWLLAASLAYACNLSISALRWQVILHALERHAPLPWLLRLNWVGAYFNQVLPGAVSGDVLRAWYTRHQTGATTIALGAVFGDRFIGLGALMAIAATAFLLGGQKVGLLPQMGWTIALLLCAYAAVVILILSPALQFLGTKAGRWGGKLHDIRLSMAALLRHRRDFALAAIISLAVQGISILTFWLLARSLGEHPDAAAIWLVWPVISLFLALPISFAGWGLREGLMVFYLSHLGMSTDQALALSLLLGFTILLTSLPGALLWLTLRDPHPGRAHL